MTTARQNIIVRAATASDAAAMAAIQVLSWRDTYAGLLPDGFLAGMSVERRTEAFIQRFTDPSYACFVAQLTDGRVVGFVDFGPTRKSEWPQEMELYAIYILKNYRGRGIGRRLVDAMRKAPAGAPFLVRVLEINPYLLFYGKIGGTRIGSESLRMADGDYAVAVYGFDV